MSENFDNGRRDVVAGATGIAACLIASVLFYVMVFPEPNPAEHFVSVGFSLALGMLARRLVAEYLLKRSVSVEK